MGVGSGTEMVSAGFIERVPLGERADLAFPLQANADYIIAW